MNNFKDLGLTKGSLKQASISQAIGRNHKPTFTSNKAKLCLEERSSSKQPVSQRKEIASTLRVKKNSDYHSNDKKVHCNQTGGKGLISRTKQLIRELKPLSTQFGKKSSTLSSSITKNNAGKHIGLPDSLKQTNKHEIITRPSKIKHLNYSTINTTTSNYSGANTSKTPSSQTSNRFFSQNSKLKVPVSTKNKDAKPFSAIFNSFEISKEAMSFDEENSNCDYFKTFYSQIINEKKKEEGSAKGVNLKPKPKRQSMEQKPIKSLKNTGGFTATLIGKSTNTVSKTIKVVRQTKMVFKP